jgi:hypothetical protein
VIWLNEKKNPKDSVSYICIANEAAERTEIMGTYLT